MGLLLVVVKYRLYRLLSEIMHSYELCVTMDRTVTGTWNRVTARRLITQLFLMSLMSERHMYIIYD